jgi:hypothetical protein
VEPASNQLISCLVYQLIPMDLTSSASSSTGNGDWATHVEPASNQLISCLVYQLIPMDLASSASSSTGYGDWASHMGPASNQLISCLVDQLIPFPVGFTSSASFTTGDWTFYCTWKQPADQLISLAHLQSDSPCLPTSIHVSVHVSAISNFRLSSSSP